MMATGVVTIFPRMKVSKANWDPLRPPSSLFVVVVGGGRDVVVVVVVGGGETGT
jgi:hypothetical protein